MVIRLSIQPLIINALPSLDFTMTPRRWLDQKDLIVNFFGRIVHSRSLFECPLLIIFDCFKFKQVILDIFIDHREATS